MELNPEEAPWKSVYKLLIGAVVPRPIGWISTVSVVGVRNLAPFSFFNVVCGNPPHVLFCPMIRSTDSKEKDSLENARATGEFVVNIVTERLAQAMNISSAELSPDVDEFERAGLTAVPSKAVNAPRVKESPIHFECRTVQVVDLSDAPGGGSVVIGRIVHIHVSDDVMYGEGRIDWARLQPIGRLAGPSYCRVTDLFDMVRPPSEILPDSRGFEGES